MSWLSSLLDPSEVKFRVSEARITQGDASLHSVGLSLATSSQRFTSKFLTPQPVDPLSHRCKVNWPDSEVRVSAYCIMSETVKVAISNRRRHLRTVVGTAEFSLLSLEPPNSGGASFKRTLHVETALLPTLNLKIDIEVELFNPGLEGWHQFVPGRSLQNSLLSTAQVGLKSNNRHCLVRKKSKFLDENNLGPHSELNQLDLNTDSEISTIASEESIESSATSIGMAKQQSPSNRSYFGFDLNSDTLGVVFLEIVSIANLPRFRSLTGISFDMDPFVIMSFGRRVYKTPYRRHTVNPTFNCKVAFDVGKAETNFDIVFTVWDQDKITLNDRVAQADMPVSTIISNQVPKQDEHTKLYDLDNHTPAMRVVPLAHEAGTAELVIKVYYYPMAAIRQQMWRGIIALYDQSVGVNNTRSHQLGLTLADLRALLNSLGSSVGDETLKRVFEKHGVEPQSGRLKEDLIVMELEELVASMSAERVILFRICPICRRKDPSSKKVSALQHLSVCASRHWAASNSVLLDKKYVSSQQASKRWYANFFSKFSYGSYQIGAHSANILVQDRISGQISEERMSTSVRLAIRVIYSLGPVEKRKFQKLLKKYTLRQGKKYSCPSSASSIEPFIRFHNLDMSEVLEATRSFKTFNEFFYRKLKPGSRPAENPDEPGTAVSAADCRLTAFSSVDMATRLWIKGRQFSIERLLGDAYPEDYKLFTDNATVLIFRLAPQDYHRVHSPVDGIMGEPKHIGGQYYTVNPMAVRSSLDVFGENVRTVFPIESMEFGRVMIIMIGAMMVGSCVVTRKPGEQVRRAEELGYFQFGGSTVVALFEQGKMIPDSDIAANSSVKIETLVKVGMSVGHTKEVPEWARSFDTRYSTISRAKRSISGGGSYLPFSFD